MSHLMINQHIRLTDLTANLEKWWQSFSIQSRFMFANSRLYNWHKFFTKSVWLIPQVPSSQQNILFLSVEKMGTKVFNFEKVIWHDGMKRLYGI